MVSASIAVVSTSILSTTVSTVEIAEAIAPRGSSSTKVAVGEDTIGEEVSFRREV